MESQGYFRNILRNDNQAKEGRSMVEPFAAQTDWILVLEILAGLVV